MPIIVTVYALVSLAMLYALFVFSPVIGVIAGYFALLGGAALLENSH